MKKTYPMSYSKANQTRLVLPPDTNHHHSIFGGRVLAYIDEVAAIAAMKHSQGEVVTASFDSVDFVSSAYAGDVIELEAMVTGTGRTSMEVYVRVVSRNVKTGAKKLTTESFVTMVAIDEEGSPKEVPGVEPENDFERHLFETGPIRQEHRKQKRALSKKRRG
ncbi:MULTISPECIES: acyl-CoA thioesterase [Solibacillus]|uniref:Acyl-CoA thioesterase n=1 Tax=Solibacillus palustris TaxID=2908203 RepID=A0ABS9UGQ8_9BACL|nr:MULTISPECIES: acyl-CoA thioesterase [Solibacillus]MCH7323538.1 acyl-CoA thioesterase [Solibacillus sp. MA9]